MPLAETPAFHRRETHLLSQFDDLLHDFLIKGGPLPAEYTILNRAIRHLADSVRCGALSREEVNDYIQDATQRYLAGTMQAEALERKYGYSGDFEIIDHIYTRRTNPDPRLRLWDLFFHSQAAPVAVRNRKAYFQQLMHGHIQARSGARMDVLNVASGPCRDLREFFHEHPHADAHVDCVDMDARALEYGRQLCEPWQERITFHHQNVLKHVPQRPYDLVWSAGLFDYLSDRLFGHLLRALLKVTRQGGEVVIGNFSDFNPSRDYMEFFGRWDLHHRSQQTLLRLATEAGISADRVEIFWEPEGVNHFMHIQC